MPLLVLLEQNDAALSGKVEALIGDYQPQNFSKDVALLQRHGALRESLRVIENHLDAARSCASLLRESEARRGLLNLCEVLAAQTEALGGAA